MNTSWFEYETELATRDRVAHPENMPFLLQPEKSNGSAVILIHGFSSSPREMRGLGEVLCKNQFTVYGVRLPGHGTSPDDLAGKAVEDWQVIIRRGYQVLDEAGFRICAAGLSTGALLTLDLARHARLDRIILLAPFLKLRHWLADHVGILSYFIRYQAKNIPAAEQPFYYALRPLKGIVQINRLRWKLKRQLHKIATPTLVLSSTGDATIAPGTAREIYQRLGSADKQIHMYGDEVPHGLTTENNPRQQDVFTRCLDFLQAGQLPPDDIDLLTEGRLRS